MTGFTTSTETMRDTSAKLLADASSISSDLQALLARLTALDGQWVGEGRLAFQTAEERYRTANTRLHGALSSIGELIARNCARYGDDDAQVRAGLSASGAHFDAPGF